jgi:hypothetical protein
LDEIEAIVGKDLTERYTWLVEKQKIESGKSSVLLFPVITLSGISTQIRPSLTVLEILAMPLFRKKPMKPMSVFESVPNVHSLSASIVDALTTARSPAASSPKPARSSINTSMAPKVRRHSWK